MKPIQEPAPLKHVFFLMRLTKFWLFMKDDKIELECSRLKSPSNTLLSNLFE